MLSDFKTEKAYEIKKIHICGNLGNLNNDIETTCDLYLDSLNVD